MPIVRVEIWEGRNRELKKNLSKDITQAMVKHLGCPEKAVSVVITDVPKDNWAIGGELASDAFKDVK
ncbi:MAG: 2-hydroxymuconate tautomerase family protein [Endomicrobiales bacterium]|nr:2-hydroxymuconate tautomerase family protein [Endomicrobiales bacterium]